MVEVDCDGIDFVIENCLMLLPFNFQMQPLLLVMDLANKLGSKVFWSEESQSQTESVWNPSDDSNQEKKIMKVIEWLENPPPIKSSWKAIISMIYSMWYSLEINLI